MSNTQLLQNRTSDGRLLIGLDNEGLLIDPQIPLNRMDITGTVQQDPSTIVSKDTYTGDDECVLDFFNRSPDDPLYGVLYTKGNKVAITNLNTVHSAFRRHFGGIKESPHGDSVLYPIITTFIKMAYSDDTITTELIDAKECQVAVDELLKRWINPQPWRDEVALVTSTTKDTKRITHIKTLIWCADQEGEWWCNHLKPTEVISQTSQPELDPITLNTSSECLSKIPTWCNDYTVVSIVTTTYHGENAGNITRGTSMVDVVRYVKESE